MDRIGFIGLGNMGRPMASNLVRKGFPLTVFDVNPAPVRQLEELGATAAADCAAAAGASDLVFTMLPDSASVEDVLLGSGGVLARLRAGSAVMDMSTIDPALTDRLASAAADKGIAFVDAPVGRLASHAERGESLFMVGRDRRGVRPGQAAARRDGHDDPSLRRRRRRDADEAREQLPGDRLVRDQRRGDRAVAAVRPVAGEDARRHARHDRDERPAQDRLGDEGAEGRHRAWLHDRSGAQGSVADRRRRQRRRVPMPIGAAAREAYSAARTQGQGGKDFSAMVDVLCDFAHINRPRLSRG